METLPQESGGRGRRDPRPGSPPWLLVSSVPRAPSVPGGRGGDRCALGGAGRCPQVAPREGGGQGAGRDPLPGKPRGRSERLGRARGRPSLRVRLARLRVCGWGGGGDLQVGLGPRRSEPLQEASGGALLVAAPLPDPVVRGAPEPGGDHAMLEDDISLEALTPKEAPQLVSLQGRCGGRGQVWLQRHGVFQETVASGTEGRAGSGGRAPASGSADVFRELLGGGTLSGSGH